MKMPKVHIKIDTLYYQEKIVWSVCKFLTKSNLTKFYEKAPKDER